MLIDNVNIANVIDSDAVWPAVASFGNEATCNRGVDDATGGCAIRVNLDRVVTGIGDVNVACSIDCYAIGIVISRNSASRNWGNGSRAREDLDVIRVVIRDIDVAGAINRDAVGAVRVCDRWGTCNAVDITCDEVRIVDNIKFVLATGGERQREGG